MQIGYRVYAACRSARESIPVLRVLLCEQKKEDFFSFDVNRVKLYHMEKDKEFFRSFQFFYAMTLFGRITAFLFLCHL